MTRIDLKHLKRIEICNVKNRLYYAKILVFSIHILAQRNRITYITWRQNERKERTR